MIDPSPPIESVVSDEAVIARVLAGDSASFEILMRRYNQRLYRTGIFFHVGASNHRE
jgi:hypothetical protein